MEELVQMVKLADDYWKAGRKVEAVAIQSNVVTAVNAVFQGVDNRSKKGIQFEADIHYCTDAAM